MNRDQQLSKRNSRIRVGRIAIFGWLVCCSFSGCHKRPTAPQLDYAPIEVERLGDEMKRMEWE